jgi:hypothetical protein
MILLFYNFNNSVDSSKQEDGEKKPVRKNKVNHMDTHRVKSSGLDFASQVRSESDKQKAGIQHIT